jgi:hypothetical protein
VQGIGSRGADLCVVEVRTASSKGTEGVVIWFANWFWELGNRDYAMWVPTISDAVSIQVIWPRVHHKSPPQCGPQRPATPSVSRIHTLWTRERAAMRVLVYLAYLGVPPQGYRCRTPRPRPILQLYRLRAAALPGVQIGYRGRLGRRVGSCERIVAMQWSLEETAAALRSQPSLTCRWQPTQQRPSTALPQTSSGPEQTVGFFLKEPHSGLVYTVTLRMCGLYYSKVQNHLQSPLTATLQKGNSSWFRVLFPVSKKKPLPNGEDRIPPSLPGYAKIPLISFVRD